MIRLTGAVFLMALLAGCGVDGEPVRPTVNGGVTISNSGIYPSASIGLGRGPVSVRVGL
ncbi:hypothetical protein [uncultured Roseobacter sp.]|uniref:hypothetical protein n=1 Tax=uncultured Roseobacter sp. TaxID=114847 RepID=UPI0026197921|nr:hypothetical protein [uncultured Roseobacter sp.]